jgi:hypothetical protein
MAFASLSVFHRPAMPVEGQPVIVVKGPTIVAFFATSTRSQNSAEANEALSDFQFYAKSVRGRLKNAGIAFHELYTHSFRLREGRRLITFGPGKRDVGYYLTAPGKKPRIEYGVMTDSDLIQAANAFFGLSVR